MTNGSDSYKTKAFVKGFGVIGRLQHHILVLCILPNIGQCHAQQVLAAAQSSQQSNFCQRRKDNATSPRITGPRFGLEFHCQRSVHIHVGMVQTVRGETTLGMQGVPVKSVRPRGKICVQDKALEPPTVLVSKLIASQWIINVNAITNVVAR